MCPHQGESPRRFDVTLFLDNSETGRSSRLPHKRGRAAQDRSAEPGRESFPTTRASPSLVALPPLFFRPARPDAGGGRVKGESAMIGQKKTSPVNASAIAVNAWIQDLEETHQQIQRELENIRYTRTDERQAKALEEIIAALRKLRAVVPTPRMITAWVGSDAPSLWN